MNVDVGIALDHHYADDLPELVVDWQAAAAPAPRTLVVNDGLAAELGIDPGFLRSDAGAAFLVGNDLPHGARPVAQAYAGHQFGSYSPRLGDGRALLLGELRVGGTRRDLHLKGSGRTPFARGGDGKAATGPMLREYVISEAMHALGIPTTRALAVVATGEPVRRDTMLPGAVLVRVAASHLRVGTFQYAAALDDGSVLRRLADHAIARHAPHATDAPTPAVALYDSVVEAQAALIAQWMQVGFIHGVMNTDNVTISGETIDYGPCAFMDRFDPATVFSSIDHHGRYAYGNQPPIAQWNLARLAEAMLPLFASTTDAAVEVATEVLNTFPGRFDRYWASGMRAKLGLGQLAATDADTALIDDWFTLVHASGADLTSTMRALGDATREAASGAAPTAARAELRSRFTEPEAFDAWHTRLLTRLRDGGTDLVAAAAAMDAHNPVYVPRNHLVEEALAAATAGDLAPVERLVEVVTQPFTRRADATRYEQPAPPSDVRYQTFCGT